MRVIVGLMPQSELIVPQSSTKSCSTFALAAVRSARLTLIIGIPLGTADDLTANGAPLQSARFVRKMPGMSRTRVKICGVTSAEDVRAAALAGADAVGFNFYPKSPRFVDPRLMSPLLQALPPLIDAVGVFVDLKIRQISALAYQLGLHSIQTFADPSDLDDPYPFRLIAAFRVKDADSVD